MNFASPAHFRFHCDKLPLLSKTIQKITPVNITLGDANVQTPFTKITQPGNIRYSDIELEFKVLEDYSNYLEIVDWMNELGHPVSTTQFKDSTIDATILPLTGNRTTAMTISIEDIQPGFLSLPTFDTTVPTVTYMTASIILGFTSIKFLRTSDVGCNI
jgi:hypothetical protein